MRLLLCLFLAVSSSFADAPVRFRTDADPAPKPGAKPDPKDPNRPPEWFLLENGKFPPEGSAHAIPGELIYVDPIERRFQIRVDRNDSQERGIWDLPLDGTMLPYGSIYYHGAPAALQDIPLGTHLQGKFYLKDPKEKTQPARPAYSNGRTPEFEFQRCFRLEDDFSANARQKQLWKIESVDLEKMKLTAVLEKEGKAIGSAKTFDLMGGTTVLRGSGFADLSALAPGQNVQLNLTWVTLYGPGRVSTVWIDETSRKLATDRQRARHLDYMRERGLPGWVSSVDDELEHVTITFFGGVDPALFDEIGTPTPANTPPPAPLPAGATPPPRIPRCALAVAKDSLSMYDPVNDRKSGDILEVLKVPVESGSSGVQVKLKMDMMLEGYRPKRVVRFYPAAWKVIALPKEELGS